MKKKLQKSTQAKNNAPYQHSLHPNLSSKPPVSQTSSFKMKTLAKSPPKPQSSKLVNKQESLKHIDMQIKESKNFPISKINLITPENNNICLLKANSGRLEISHQNTELKYPYGTGTLRDFEIENNKDIISKDSLHQIVYKAESSLKIIINNAEIESKSSFKRRSLAQRNSFIKPNYLNRFEIYMNKSINENDSIILKPAASNPGSNHSSKESTPKVSPQKSLKKNSITNSQKRRCTVFLENNKGFFGQSNVCKIDRKKDMSLNLKFYLQVFLNKI